MALWARICADTRERWHGDGGGQPRLGRGRGEGSGLSYVATPRREKPLSLQWGNSPAALLTAVDGKEK